MCRGKIVAVIQARISSERLPGKVLLDLAGEPMLVREVNRLARSKMLNEIVIATSINPEDEKIVDLCKERGWNCFRGDEDDVLDRFYQTALIHRADVIVRITADCPLIDPEVVDQVINEFINHQPEIDYVSNIAPKRTYPRGLDTEVFRFDVLERAWQEDKNPASREHVTPYIRERSDLFKTYGVICDQDYSHMRWTVDTPEDLAFVRLIFDYFDHDMFSFRDVLTTVKAHPEWSEINKDVEQKAI
jgi:spore coat polysaccharide biosynthesis protein SpsF